jgi:hypothetical protein
MASDVQTLARRGKPKIGCFSTMTSMGNASVSHERSWPMSIHRIAFFLTFCAVLAACGTTLLAAQIGFFGS